MSQNDMTIANASGATVRTDIQSNLQALASTSKGGSRPSTPYAGQMWIDDNTPTSAIWTVYFYDGADDVPVGLINSTTNIFYLSNTVPLSGSGGVSGAYYYTGDVLFGQNSTLTPGASNTTLGAMISANGSAHFSNDGSYVVSVNRNSDGVLQNLARSGTTVGDISITSSAVAFNTTSDYRLKENLTPLTGSWALLAAIPTYLGNFKAEPEKIVPMVLAHEVQEQAPESVTGEKDGERMQGWDPGKMMPRVLNALAEAHAKVAELEARIVALGG